MRPRRRPLVSDRGLLDVLLARFLAIWRPKKFFPKGYGDIDSVHARRDEYYHRVRTGSVDVFLQPDDIEWEMGHVDSRHCTVQEGSFWSPLADMLPAESQRCHFHVVKPKKCDKRPQIYIVMLASTGETGRKPRLAMAKKLAKRYGYTSIILSTAFYGRRKPASQTLFYPDTVSDMWKQYGAVVQEASVLAEYFLRTDAQSKVCFTAFSAGACLAICAACTCILGYRLDGSRIGVAAHATPSSAAVFATGCVSHMMDWKALRGHEDEPLETTRNLLESELSLLSIGAVLALRENSSNNDNNSADLCRRLGSLQCTAFRHDLVSPREYALSLTPDLASLVRHPADCAVDWLPGGHVHAYFIRFKWQMVLIQRAVAPLVQGTYYSAPTSESV